MRGDLPSVGLLDALHFQSQLRWAHAAALFFLVTSFALLLVVHLWRGKIAGPLTQEEKARAKWPLWRRYVYRQVPMALAGLAWLAAARLVVTVERPAIAVLHSRARPAGQVTGLVPRTARVTIYDLGPVVDRIVTSIGGLCGSWDGSVAHRQQLNHVIEATLASMTLPEAASQASVPPSFLDCPRDLIESVELSVTRIIGRERNVLQFRVAPRPFVGVSPWQTARALLAAAELRLQLVDEREIQAEKLAIKKIAAARVDSAARLSFWFLLSGRLNQETLLRFRLFVAGRAADFVEVPLAADAYLSRVVRVDPRAIGVASCRGLRIEIDDPTHTIARTPARCMAEERPPAYVRTREPFAWRRAFESIRGAFGPPDRAGPLAALAEEMRILDVRFPVIVERGDHPVLLRTGGRTPQTSLLVIAQDGETASSVAAALLRARPPAIVPQRPRARVTESRLGPSTVFSWHGLDVLDLDGFQGSSPGETAILAAPAQETRIEAGYRRAHAHSWAWQQTKTTPGRFVVLELAGLNQLLDTQSSHVDAEPTARLALLRTVAWAAERVRSESASDDLPDAEDEMEERELLMNGFAVPTITDAELARILARRRSPTAAVCIAILGVYLVSMTVALRRALGQRRRGVRSAFSPRP